MFDVIQDDAVFSIIRCIVVQLSGIFGPLFPAVGVLKEPNHNPPCNQMPWVIFSSSVNTLSQRLVHDPTDFEAANSDRGNQYITLHETNERSVLSTKGDQVIDL